MNFEDLLFSPRRGQKRQPLFTFPAAAASTAERDMAESGSQAVHGSLLSTSSSFSQQTKKTSKTTQKHKASLLVKKTAKSAKGAVKEMGIRLFPFLKNINEMNKKTSSKSSLMEAIEALPTNGKILPTGEISLNLAASRQQTAEPREAKEANNIIYRAIVADYKPLVVEQCDDMQLCDEVEQEEKGEGKVGGEEVMGKKRCEGSFGDRQLKGGEKAKHGKKSVARASVQKGKKQERGEKKGPREGCGEKGREGDAAESGSKNEKEREVEVEIDEWDMDSDVEIGEEILGELLREEIITEARLRQLYKCYGILKYFEKKKVDKVEGETEGVEGDKEGKEADKSGDVARNGGGQDEIRAEVVTVGESSGDKRKRKDEESDSCPQNDKSKKRRVVDVVDVEELSKETYQSFTSEKETSKRVRDRDNEGKDDSEGRMEKRRKVSTQDGKEWIMVIVFDIESLLMFDY